MKNKVKNNSYQPGVVKLEGIRLAYPCLDKPQTPKNINNAVPKFGATFWIKKNDRENMDKIRKEFLRISAGNADPSRWALVDGDKPSIEVPPIPGHCILNARNKVRPILLDASREEIPLEKITEVFYGGCYVTASINFWFFNRGDESRVVATLLGVQFVCDGKNIIPEVSDKDAFDTYSDQDIDQLQKKIRALNNTDGVNETLGSLVGMEETTVQIQ